MQDSGQKCGNAWREGILFQKGAFFPESLSIEIKGTVLQEIKGTVLFNW